jgi:HEPN domain-containing protein
LAIRSLDFADVRTETGPWWRQAQADLETAEFTLQGGRFYAASVFAQQAAEKAVKAVYIERRQQIPPRTHDLGLFAAQLAVPEAVENDLLSLNPTFGLSRYPDSVGTAPVDAIGATDATPHVEAARRVLQWASGQL